jgi:hypothetical protein
LHSNSIIDYNNIMYVWSQVNTIRFQEMHYRLTSDILRHAMHSSVDFFLTRTNGNDDVFYKTSLPNASEPPCAKTTTVTIYYDTILHYYTDGLRVQMPNKPLTRSLRSFGCSNVPVPLSTVVIWLTDRRTFRSTIKRKI